MTQSNSQSRRSEGGFTLVELAIVMIIIGLLIGGILKGQELINNARVSSTAAQVNAVEAGISTFRDKYNGVPGDLAQPIQRIPNCATGLCAIVGDGNGQIEMAAAAAAAVDPGVALLATYEAAAAFPQMAAASMIGGVSDPLATAVAAGTTNPTLPVGGTWQIGYSNGATGTGLLSTTGLPSGNYLVSVTTVGTAAASTNAPMSPVQAGNIDRKLDDGAPLTGEVRAISAAAGATSCAVVAGGATIYNEAISTINCGLYAKVQ